MTCRSFGCFRQDGILASSAHSPAATHMAATAAACLCTDGEKAAGQYWACQNHHYPSSHDILLGIGGLPLQSLVRRWHVRVGQPPTSR
jgi:hypothetical protein